jgi:hypothetical protein
VGRVAKLACGLLYVLSEDMSMDKNPDKEQDTEQDSDVDREDAVRRLLEEESGDHDTFNPRTGEDPGLLPLTEDPLERRLKRNTM